MTLILWCFITLMLGVSIGLSWAERKEIQKRQEELEKKLSNLAYQIRQRKEFKDVEI